MKLAEFFQDPTGGFSSVRLAFLVWSLGVFIVWAVASLSEKSVKPIDTSIIMMIGAVSTAKVVQRFGEKEEPPQVTPSK